MRRSILTLALGLTLAAGACSGPDATGTARITAPTPARSPSATPTPQPTPTDERAPAIRLPDPKEPIPSRPEPLAELLFMTDRNLDLAIDAWVARPGSPGRPPDDVALLALLEQRISRALARDPALLAGVIERVPRPLAAEANANATAAAELLSLITPVDSAGTFRTRPPPAAGDLLRFYQQAERRFGVEWEVLAAVHFVETKFSRVRSASSAGAQGPMQFIPSTWAAYGLGGNVHDDRDAILGAANYLRASGAPGDYSAALFAYNHAQPYVAAVLLYARRMMIDPNEFFAYYGWQVFVLTTSGDVRLTGPGR